VPNRSVFDLLLGIVFKGFQICFRSVLGQPPSLKILPTESSLKLVILCSLDASL
jgi:hypothetical protein